MNLGHDLLRKEKCDLVAFAMYDIFINFGESGNTYI
jgi:hypothetical protein